MPPSIQNNQGPSLQERLHTLLTRLSDTSEILKKWPETKTGDDGSIHVRTTEKLISSIQRIVEGIKSVEEKVNYVNLTEQGSTDYNTGSGSGDDDIANKLRQIAVPLDLLDMMDFAGGLNPDCFARGLIKEALRQMGNLQRRKASMKMLAAAIQNGLDARERQLEILKSLDEKLASHANSNTKSDKRQEESQSSFTEDAMSSGSSKKRKRDDSEQADASEEPAPKR